MVKGLILAGSADFKRELSETQFLEKTLKDKIMALVDVSYGGQAGLVEALGRCKETLQDM
jgi:peptide chain release factor subunit 1